MRRSPVARRRLRAVALTDTRPGLAALTAGALLALAAVLAALTLTPGGGEPWLSGPLVEFLMPRH